MKNWMWLLGPLFFLGACSEAPSPVPTLLPLPSATPSPVVAAQAETPVVIASPTPSPTPVTYVVQKGDTLVGIAVKYGVSVEALQSANNNVQPEFLSIGAALVIPSPEGGTPVAVSSLPTPTPAPLTLGPVACYPTATGALYCFVEARNPGPAPLENVSARIILADKDGLPLLNDVAYSALDVIPPGAAAPLPVRFPSAPAGIAATAAQVLSAEPSADPAAHILLLDIPHPSGAGLGTEWTVTGQVHNPSAVPAASIWLILTLYDRSGAILGYRKAPLAGGLAPGEARDFSISAASLGGAVDHDSLAAEGRP